MVRAAARLISGVTRSNSLHRRLSWLLLGPLLAVSAISGALAYFVAVDAATRAYDRSLMDPALALAKYLDTASDPPQLKLTQEAVDALRIDAVDRLVFRVSTAGGAIVSGTDELDPPPLQAEQVDHVYYDAHVGGVPMRAIALFIPSPAGRLTIQVAETKVKLTSLVRDRVGCRAGDRIHLNPDLGRAHLFDADSGERLRLDFVEFEPAAHDRLEGNIS